MGLIGRQENISMIKNKILWSTFKIRWGCSPIASPFPPPMLGRHFSLTADNKPLLSLFQEHKAIPSHASAHIQRWALTLAAYEYTFTTQSTTAHANADPMSRLPLTDTIKTPVPAEMILTLDYLQEAPITDEQI